MIPLLRRSQGTSRIDAGILSEGAALAHPPVSHAWIPVVAMLTGMAFGITSPAQAAKPARIAIVLTPHETYQEAASAAQTALEKAGHICTVVQLPESTAEPNPTETKPPAEGQDPAASAPADPTSTPATTTAPANAPDDEARRRLLDARPSLVVAVGTKATAFALDALPEIPVVFSMIPNALDMDAMAKDDPNRSRLAGVTTDVSPVERIRWMAELHPQAKRIAILYSPRTRLTVEAIRVAAEAQGITVVPIEARQQEFPKAIEALDSQHGDGVLMIADAAVYNAANIRRLLLWGIRQKKPVWAFSANIVKAGAFAGQYADAEAIGRQTAALAAKIIGGTKVSAVGLQYPSDVSAAINERIADMIGIEVGDETLEGTTVRFGTDR